MNTNSIMLVCLALLVQSGITAAQDNAAKNLNTAKDFQAVQQLVQKHTQSINIELQSLAEKGDDIPSAEIVRLLKKEGDYKVAAGDKQLQIGKQDWEQEHGYLLLISGLEVLDKAEKLEYAEKKRQESGGNPPPRVLTQIADDAKKLDTAAAKRIRELMNAAAKEGKYHNLVGNYRNNKYHEKYFGLTGTFDSKIFGEFMADTQELMNWNFSSMPPEEVVRAALNVSRAASVQRTGSIFGSLFGSKQKDWKAETVEALTKFVNSRDCTLPASQKKAALSALRADARRIVGAELKMYGKLIDGKDLDWNALLKKNKVILVKFTATWCGPCKMEEPVIKKAYEKYRDKGFDVVSVYVWENGDGGNIKKIADEKLPWTAVSEHLTVESGGKGHGTYYGIEGVPAMLLVDGSGKVIDTEVRGAALEKKLAELLK